MKARKFLHEAPLSLCRGGQACTLPFTPGSPAPPASAAVRLSACPLRRAEPWILRDATARLRAERRPSPSGARSQQEHPRGQLSGASSSSGPLPESESCSATRVHRCACAQVHVHRCACTGACAQVRTRAILCFRHGASKSVSPLGGLSPCPGLGDTQDPDRVPTSDHGSVRGVDSGAMGTVSEQADSHVEAAAAEALVWLRQLGGTVLAAALLPTSRESCAGFGV